MRNQKRATGAALPPGGQRVNLNERERTLLWQRVLIVGALCLTLLATLGLTLALGLLPLWAALLFATALLFPGRAAQNRLNAVASDLRAGTAVLHTTRLEAIRRAGALDERCYAMFSGVGEFSLDSAAYPRLCRRVGRSYRIVYSPSSRVLLAIEPVG